MHKACINSQWVLEMSCLFVEKGSVYDCKRIAVLALCKRIACLIVARVGVFFERQKEFY